MALKMRAATRDEVGSDPRTLDTLVVALIRRGKVVSLGGPVRAVIETGDMLVYIRDDRDLGSPVPAGGSPSAGPIR